MPVQTGAHPRAQKSGGTRAKRGTEPTGDWTLPDDEADPDSDPDPGAESDSPVAQRTADRDRALEAALEQWYAQLSTYLSTREFANLEGSELRKAEIARDALESRLSGRPSSTDFLADFFRDLDLNAPIDTRPPKQRRTRRSPVGDPSTDAE